MVETLGSGATEQGMAQHTSLKPSFTFTIRDVGEGECPVDTCRTRLTSAPKLMKHLNSTHSLATFDTGALAALAAQRIMRCPYCKDSPTFCIIMNEEGRLHPSFVAHCKDFKHEQQPVTLLMFLMKETITRYPTWQASEIMKSTFNILESILNAEPSINDQSQVAALRSHYGAARRHMKENGGRGRCLYEAMADATGNRENAAALKAMLLACMERNENAFPGIAWEGERRENVVVKPVSMSEYVAQMRSDSAWGGSPELSCFATLLHRVLKMELRIVQWGGGSAREQQIPQIEDASFIITEDERNLLLQAKAVMLASNWPLENILLAHVGRVHYMAVLPAAPEDVESQGGSSDDDANDSQATRAGSAPSPPPAPKLKAAKRSASMPAGKPSTKKITRSQTMQRRDQDDVCERLVRANDELDSVLQRHLVTGEASAGPRGAAPLPEEQHMDEATLAKLRALVREHINQTSNGGRVLTYVPTGHRQMFMHLARSYLRAWRRATDPVEKTEHLLSFLSLPSKILAVNRGARSESERKKNQAALHGILEGLQSEFDAAQRRRRTGETDTERKESGVSQADVLFSSSNDCHNSDSASSSPSEIEEVCPSSAPNTRAQTRARENRAAAPKNGILNDRAYKQVADHIHRGHTKKAINILRRTATMADTGQQSVRDDLAAKHPHHSISEEAIEAMRLARNQRTTINPDESLKRLIYSLDKGSAPGYDGFSAELVKVIIQDDECFSIVAELLSAIANGDFPAPVADVFTTCSLIGLQSGDKTRPIAIAPIFYRISAKIVAAAVTKQAKTLLAPHQVGVGVQSACEVVAHHVRQTLRLKPEWSMISNDFKNAYNSMSKSRMIELVMQEQSLAPMRGIVKMAYSKPSTLLLRDANKQIDFESDWNLQSQQGTRQGDNLSSILFDVALQHLLRKIQSETCSEQQTLVAYQDDVFLLGEPAAIAATFRRLQVLAKAELDLDIQPAKCTYVDFHRDARSQDELDAIASMNIKFEERCIKLLGTPIGLTNEAEVPMLKSITEERLFVLQTMKDHRLSAQDATILLKKHIIPGFTYWLRTTCPDTHRELAKYFDNEIFKFYLLKANLKLNYDEAHVDKQKEIRDLITSTVSIGGTGLIPVCNASEAAHIAAMASASSTHTNLHHHFVSSAPINLYPILNSCLDNTHRLMEAVTKLQNENTGRPNVGMRSKGVKGAAAIPLPQGQLASSKSSFSASPSQKLRIPRDAKSLFNHYSVENFDNLPALSLQTYIGRWRKSAKMLDHFNSFPALSLLDQIRFQARRAPHANRIMCMGDYGPSPRLTDEQWTYYQAQIVGLPMHAANTRGKCSFCHEDGALHRDPLHFTACKKGGNQHSITYRHDSTKRIFAHHLSKLGIVFEETNDWANCEKRADVQFTNDSAELLIDIQHTNPFSPSFQNQQRSSKPTALHATHSRELGKQGKYDKTATPQHNPNAVFTPAIFEAMGGFGQHMQDLMEKIKIMAINQVGPVFAHELVFDFINEIACNIVKCNASMYKRNVNRIDYALTAAAFDGR